MFDDSQSLGAKLALHLQKIEAGGFGQHGKGNFIWTCGKIGSNCSHNYTFAVYQGNHDRPGLR